MFKFSEPTCVTWRRRQLALMIIVAYDWLNFGETIHVWHSPWSAEVRAQYPWQETPYTWPTPHTEGHLGENECVQGKLSSSITLPVSSMIPRASSSWKTIRCIKLAIKGCLKFTQDCLSVAYDTGQYVKCLFRRAWSTAGVTGRQSVRGQYCPMEPRMK
jgi:hypothetical protein